MLDTRLQLQASFQPWGLVTTDYYSVVARFNSLDALEVID